MTAAGSARFAPFKLEAIDFLMDVLGWITNPKKSPPPPLDEAAVSATERLMQEHARKHQLPDIKGNEAVRAVAQGLRARFDGRLCKTTADLLRSACTPYSPCVSEPAASLSSKKVLPEGSLALIQAGWRGRGALPSAGEGAWPSTGRRTTGGCMELLLYTPCAAPPRPAGPGAGGPDDERTPARSSPRRSREAGAAGEFASSARIWPR